MRFLLTLMCMIVIGLAATVLVVVDLLLRWLPVVVVAVAVLAAVKVSRRRRHPQALRAAVSPSVVSVPDMTAFTALGSRRADATSTPLCQGGHGVPWGVVVDGTVIGEEAHRG